MSEGHSRPPDYDKQRERGTRRIPRGIRKLLPFCLDLAGLLGDSWSGEPPYPCVTLVQCRKMCHSVLPSSSEDFSLQRTPLEPSTKAKNLQMEAEGSCQENGGPSRPGGRSRGSRKAGVRQPRHMCPPLPQHCPQDSEGSPRRTWGQVRSRWPGGLRCCHTQRSIPQP